MRSILVGIAAAALCVAGLVGRAAGPTAKTDATSVATMSTIEAPFDAGCRSRSTLSSSSIRSTTRACSRAREVSGRRSRIK